MHNLLDTAVMKLMNAPDCARKHLNIEVVNTICYETNSFLLSGHVKLVTPFEINHNQRSNLGKIIISSSRTFVDQFKQKRIGTFDTRANEGELVKYSKRNAF